MKGKEKLKGREEFGRAPTRMREGIDMKVKKGKKEKEGGSEGF